MTRDDTLCITVHVSSGSLLFGSQSEAQSTLPAKGRPRNTITDTAPSSFRIPRRARHCPAFTTRRTLRHGIPFVCWLSTNGICFRPPVKLLAARSVPCSVRLRSESGPFPRTGCTLFAAPLCGRSIPSSFRRLNTCILELAPSCSSRVQRAPTLLRRVHAVITYVQGHNDRTISDFPTVCTR